MRRAVGEEEIEGIPTLARVSPMEGSWKYLVREDLRQAAAKVDSLTGRQLQVLELLADGLDNKSIARHMGVSEATVKQLMSLILARLHLQSRLQAGLVGFAVLVVADGRSGNHSSTNGSRILPTKV